MTNMNEKKLRIGVMGVYRGKSVIDVLTYYHEDAELVAICDKYEPGLAQVKEEAIAKGFPDIVFYNDFDAFLKHDMDAVVLANYANEHATFAVRCLEAGKHVLSEVLPCETMAQAVALVEAVEKSGKVYAYAENYCYMKPTFAMWRKYREGKIGEIVYGTGEYIHDCSSIWPQITYGDKNHWRNRMFPTYYCTHSLGPLLTISGRRPVRVVGYEVVPNAANLEKAGMLGGIGGTGIEMVTLDNGAVVQSLHGHLKREPGSNNWQVYCQKGMMESGRFEENAPFNYYQEEKERVCEGEWEKSDPVPEIRPDMVEHFPGHGGSDFYPIYCFIQKILGKPDGIWSIDVYTAVEMGMCGILAWRSVLAGNEPIDIPNLRNPEEREAYRNDHACTTPEIAGDQLLPTTTYEGTVPDEMFAKMQEYWEAGKNANGDPDLIYSKILTPPSSQK